MQEDRELINAVWDGKVAACFKLAQRDCRSSKAAEPFFMMLPRISYFPFVWDDVRKHFARFVNDDFKGNPMWLDYDSRPLRWQYPIGLLFDMHAERGTILWHITVNFSDFPAKEIIECESRQIADAHFIQTLKEADFQRTNMKVFNSLMQSARRQFISALQNLNVDSFWNVNRKVMCSQEAWKYVPIKIFTARDEKRYQRLTKPQSTDGVPLTIGDVVREWVEDFSEDDHEVIIQGIRAPLDAPLQNVSLNLSHADNFLYIVLRPLVDAH